MKTQEHAHLCAALIAAHAAIELFTLVVILVIFGAGMAFAVPEIQQEIARNNGDPEAMRFAGGMMAVVFTLVAVMVGLRVILSAFAAWGVWKARPWGKIVAIISSALSCLSFPLGTAVGVYGLWFVLGEHGTAWFGGTGTTPPPARPSASAT